MKALGYVRCSTDEQADSGAGLAAQELTIREECARRGWEVEIITDPGFTAANLKRPGIQRALHELDAGNAGALVTSKLDRLSRSLLDFATLMAQARDNGWSIVCLDANVDTSTASGELMANVLASFAQFERRLISQRTKDGLAVKRSQGVKLGRPSNVPQSVQERIRTLYATERSFAKVANVLNAENVPTAQGGVKWHPETVRGVWRRLV